MCWNNIEWFFCLIFVNDSQFWLWYIILRDRLYWFWFVWCFKVASHRIVLWFTSLINKTQNSGLNWLVQCWQFNVGVASLSLHWCCCGNNNLANCITMSGTWKLLPVVLVVWLLWHFFQLVASKLTEQSFVVADLFFSMKLLYLYRVDVAMNGVNMLGSMVMV